MTTVIAVYNSQGCVGRCDAKCHEAQEPVCHCVCGGVNHGAGIIQARANTKKIAEARIRANVSKDQADKTLRVFKEQRQLKMFD